VDNGEFVEISPGRTISKKQYEQIRTNAEANRPVAEYSKEVIRGQLRLGNKSILQDQNLLLGSISDRPELNLSNKRGRVSAAQTTVGPELDEEIKHEKGLRTALQTIDTFQLKLSRSVSALESFSVALDKSANDTENIFNQSQGHYQLNENFVNPFDSIEGLSKKQISQEINKLEDRLGTSINPDIKRAAVSIPSIENFSDLLNKEINKANAKGTGGDQKALAINLLNDKHGPFADLPDILRKEFTNIFENLDPSKLPEVLAGRDKSLDAAKDNIQEGVKKYLQTNTELLNKLEKTLQDDFNKLGQQNVQRGQLSQNFQLARGQGIELSRELRGERPNASLSISLQEQAVKALGGSAQPQELLDIVRNSRQKIQFENERYKDIADTPQNRLEHDKTIIGLSTEADKAQQALGQLAQSAIGLSAIQKELTDLEKRRQGAIGASVDDVLGGNRRGNFKADLALKIFQGGTLGDVARSGLNQQDLSKGYQRRLEYLQNFGAPKDIEEFQKKFGTRLTQQGASVGLIDKSSAAERIAAINNKQIDNLRDTVDSAVKRQLDAINAQKALLDDSITNLDVTLQNKFLTGVDNLSKIVKNFNIPETVSMNVKIDHTVTVIGPNYNGLDKYVRAVAESTVNKAISQMTEGRSTPTKTTQDDAQT
jgi:hypothetical protein